MGQKQDVSVSEVLVGLLIIAAVLTLLLSLAAIDLQNAAARYGTVGEKAGWCETKSEGNGVYSLVCEERQLGRSLARFRAEETHHQIVAVVPITDYGFGMRTQQEYILITEPYE